MSGINFDLVSSPNTKAIPAIVATKSKQLQDIGTAELVSAALQNSKKIAAAATGGRGQLLDIHV